MLSQQKNLPQNRMDTSPLVIWNITYFVILSFLYLVLFTVISQLKVGSSIFLGIMSIMLFLFIMININDIINKKTDTRFQITSPITSLINHLLFFGFYIYNIFIGSRSAKNAPNNSNNLIQSAGRRSR
jgi:hypothetical protein